MRRDGPGHERRGHAHAALGEEPPQFLQRPRHALFRGIFAGAQRHADLAQIAALIEPQNDGAAVLLPQGFHGGIHHRGDLGPDVFAGFIQKRLHVGLLFPALPPDLASHKIAGRQPRRLKEPTGKRRVVAQAQRLLGQDNEDRLRDFLRLMRVADLPQGHRIHQVNMPRHQLGERLVGTVRGVLAQQRAVIRWLHLRISVRRGAGTDSLFAARHRPSHPQFISSPADGG